MSPHSPGDNLEVHFFFTHKGQLLAQKDVHKKNTAVTKEASISALNIWQPFLIHQLGLTCACTALMNMHGSQ